MDLALSIAFVIPAIKVLHEEFVTVGQCAFGHVANLSTSGAKRHQSAQAMGLVDRWWCLSRQVA
jgi:hypothetical protein